MGATCDPIKCQIKSSPKKSCEIFLTEKDRAITEGREREREIGI